MLLSDGKQRELRVEVDKLLDDYLLHITATAFHRLLEGLLQLTVIMHVALAVTTRRHQRLHDTWEANLIGSILELIEGLGIEILRRAQTQFLRSQVADGAAVHGVVDGTGRGNHLNALFLELEKPLRADGLDLRNNDIRLVFVDDSFERIAVEHREHFTLICHLHSGRIVISVAGNHILAGTHGGNHELLTQFS